MRFNNLSDVLGRISSALTFTNFFRIVPSVAPTELSVLASTPTEIYVQWKPIPDDKYHGRKLGYRVKYRPYFASEFKIKIVPYGMNSVSVNNLKPFTLYLFEVEAFTGAGPGLPVAANLKTPEGGNKTFLDYVVTILGA